MSVFIDTQAIARKWAIKCIDENLFTEDAIAGAVTEAVALSSAKEALEQRRLLQTVVEILVARRPGAALNAVTEDYPEIAKLISGVVQK